MPVRVELIDEAVQDLVNYAESGKLPLFLKKLLRLEEYGEDAGLPLGKGLAGWRKIVVGDRDWRMIFAMNADKTVATVWVIGDRSDAACYEEAQSRIAKLAQKAAGSGPDAGTLATVMFELSEMQRSAKRARRKR